MECERSLAAFRGSRKDATVSDASVTAPSTAAAPPAPGSKPTYALQGWQRMAIWPLGLLLRWWGRTLRIELAPEDRAAFEVWDRPVTMVIWHNRLFLSSEIIRQCRRGRPVHALISASRDGAWLAAFFQMIGLAAVRGSSSRGAREAVSALIDVMRGGHDIGITPDGPRGPRYEFKPGGLIVARRAGAPLLLIGGEFHHAHHLRSWDRFCVPWPFSKVTLRCRRLDPARLPREREAALAELTRVMQEINPD
jgi:lysophospholipid acyltransferase (LPLAT)-like uncharacterized protein